MDLIIVINFVLCLLIPSPLTNANDTILTLPACDYTAIYNFGDSNSDTGGIYAAFYPTVLPYGETFFHRPATRASDGRLMIDFIAEKLGLPYMSAYLDSIASNFSRGANFATGGATIRRPESSWFQIGVSPFNLEIQVEHFIQLKERSAYFYKQEKNSEMLMRLPRPEELEKALFIIDIGQNDVAGGKYNLSPEAIAGIVSQFIQQVRSLCWAGGKTFWIHNTGPLGCLPAVLSKESWTNLDKHGCVKGLNKVASEFNKQLKNELDKLRQEFPRLAIVHVDMYAAKYALISNAKDQGFQNASTICCGYLQTSSDILCGKNGTLNNGTTVFADSCNDPNEFISWDGVHYTESANHWFANRIEDGSLSDPPLPLSRACHGKAKV